MSCWLAGYTFGWTWTHITHWAVLEWRARQGNRNRGLSFMSPLSINIAGSLSKDINTASPALKRKQSDSQQPSSNTVKIKNLSDCHWAKNTFVHWRSWCSVFCCCSRAYDSCDFYRAIWLFFFGIPGLETVTHSGLIRYWQIHGAGGAYPRTLSTFLER